VLVAALVSFCTQSAGALFVRIETTLGFVDVELFDDGAPVTVANFMNYVNDGDYDNSFFHRSMPGFVLQGGGFTFQNNLYDNVPTDAPIVNEFDPSRSNLRGTLAMAKTAAGPDTATSQWFFNLSNNSANLDTQNGGFTVFGRVLGDGMDVVDAISALPIYDITGIHPAFTDVPLNGYTGTYDPANQLVFINNTKPSDTLGGPVDLNGNVQTVGAQDVCAMVLASGQFMFSCNPPGEFSLSDLSREKNGTVKRQIYADGFFPKIDTRLGSGEETVVMTRSGTCPNYNTPYDPGVFPDSAGKRINISGKVLLQNNQTPICAMALANGQYMFTCDGTGNYALNIPLDTDGQFKLQVYADGFAPITQKFDEFNVSNDILMARAVECQ
jgi:cyclophilin family peptidyl-prolyl cis-trans isomerase